eukprot:tig00000123_g6910.t1
MALISILTSAIQGTISNEKGTQCLDCPAGTYQPPDQNVCVPCTPIRIKETAVYLYSPGKLYGNCIFCPKGKYASTLGTHCIDCDRGFYMRNESYFCEQCPANTYAPNPGQAYACLACLGGYVNAPDFTSCIPCRPGTFRNASMTVCTSCAERCSVNTISTSGSGSCKVCELGQVSTDGLSCTACPPGTYRNATLIECTPCSTGTYANASGMPQCLPCPVGKYCPVGSRGPIDGRLRETEGDTDLTALLDSNTRRSRSRGLLALGRRALGIALPDDAEDLEFEVDLQWQKRSLDFNTVNITQAVVKTEESTQNEMKQRFLYIGSALAGGLVFFGLLLVFYLWLLPATPEKREQRFRFVHRFHLLYKGNFFVYNEAAEEHEAIAADAAKGDMSGEPVCEKGRTSSGAFFTLFGVVAIAVAVSFIAVQYSTANFAIIQTLQLGTSPTAADINGRFRIVTIFRGYTGNCDASEAGVALSGISGGGVLSFVKVDAGQSCRVQWLCDDCKITAVDGVYAELRLVSRMAYAVAVPYRIEVPEFIRAEGLIKTSSDATVFRGIRSVKLPVQLTPMHFSDPKDGRERYHLDISPADTVVSEKDETQFAVCPPFRPIAECPEDVVSFRVEFEQMGLFVNVERVIRSSLLDAISDMLGLASAAFGIGGQAFVAYIIAKKFLKKVPEQQYPEAIERAFGFGRHDKNSKAPAGKTMNGNEVKATTISL